VQVAAGSACREISTEIEFTGASAAESANEPRSPRVATTESWALAKVGARRPLQANPLPLAVGEFHLNRVSVGAAGGEGRVAEIGRDRCSLFSEQAELEQFIDIDNAVGQPEFFDQDAFAHLSDIHLFFTMSYI
jgi:hypothetical protein